MKQAVADVYAFRSACDAPKGDTPQFPPEDRKDLCLALNAEEDRELILAVERRDIEGVADGIVDGIYTRVFMALEFGIPIERVWAEVQRANMRKVDVETGKVRRAENGKILKPDGWIGPNVAAALWADVLEEV